MPVSRWLSTLASLTRHYPLLSGCGTIANHRFAQAILPPRPELVWAPSVGGDLQVMLDDFVGRAVYLFGDLDPKITWIIRRLLGPGDTALDIGANFGLVTLLMSKLVGSTGIVHAFEPNPVLCQILRTTFAHNDCANTKLHPVALGNADGQMELHVPAGNAGAASLVRRPKLPTSVHSISVMRLDDVVARESISRIAFMKLDVEGFELQVLGGAQRVLGELRPAAILFESNDEAEKACGITPVVRYLQNFDYKFLSVPRRIMRMTTRVLDPDRSNGMVGHDTIAAPNGAAFVRLCRLLNARDPAA